MDSIDQLFAKKKIEAAEIVAAKTRNKTEEESQQQLPFEVNKVINKIDELTEKRKKLFKRKQ